MRLIIVNRLTQTSVRAPFPCSPHQPAANGCQLQPKPGGRKKGCRPIPHAASQEAMPLMFTSGGPPRFSMASMAVLAWLHGFSKAFRTMASMLHGAPGAHTAGTIMELHLAACLWQPLSEAPGGLLGGCLGANFEQGAQRYSHVHRRLEGFEKPSETS
ncbi:hypothetical protein G7046_g4954 [Stylonectria norvegica]|nr:hypothetical protein G7046_g4954 [Stylonectria norvegica]